MEHLRHAVTVYDREDELLALVTRFALEGLAAGETVLLVLTPAHRVALETRLREHRTDVAAVTASGHLRTVDAGQALACYFVDGDLDEPAFTAMASTALDDAARSGRPLRVFGEMVNLLWDAGHARRALRLEALWNELARTRSFLLHCAYSTAALQAHACLPELDELTRVHSALAPPRSYTDADPGTDAATPVTSGQADAARAFVATSAAVPAARRWVEATLRAWGEDALVPDAALVTSELATNAVRHASSAFRARLTREGPTVRLSFEDLAHERPTLHDPTRDATGGRGVAIVEQTSARWGLLSTPDGKVVWAEFPSAAA